MNKELDLKQQLIHKDYTYYLEQYKKSADTINVLNKYQRDLNLNDIVKHKLNDAIIILDQLKEEFKPSPKGPLPFIVQVFKKIIPAKGAEEDILLYKETLKKLRDGKDRKDLRDEIPACANFFEKLKRDSLIMAFKSSPNQDTTLDIYRNILLDEDTKK